MKKSKLKEMIIGDMPMKKVTPKKASKPTKASKKTTKTMPKGKC